MSIRITQNNCVGCGRCIEACPGNLIKKDVQGKAVIKHISDCWGCTSCLKECKTGAINRTFDHFFTPRLTVQAIGEQLFFHQPTVKLILQFRYP